MTFNMVDFKDKVWLKRVAYLADILEEQSNLKLKLQEKEADIIAFKKNLGAFISKLQNWRRIQIWEMY